MSVDGTEDRLLVERFRRDRDEESFRVLYRRHGKALFRLCLGHTSTEADAADAVQETWLRATRGLDRFRWRSTFRTWLFGIALNCCREIERERAGNPPERDDGSGITPEPKPVADAVRALRILPERTREVFLLHELFGFTHAEIGKILTVEAGTSKSQLSYARKLIRRWATRTGPDKGDDNAG